MTRWVNLREEGVFVFRCEQPVHFLTECAKRVTLSVSPCKIISSYTFLMHNPKLDPELAREAKAIVVLAFRNGPIENLHAGKRCSVCQGKTGYSRITDAEMKAIMKNAVDHVYRFAGMKQSDPLRYKQLIEYGNQVAWEWDDPATS